MRITSHYPHCYPPTCAPVPEWVLRPTTAAPVVNHTHSGIPSIQEQMGTDPISKLAAAIEKLADALRGDGGTEV